MTPADLKASLALLGMSQLGAARLFKVNGRTVRRWVSGEQPIPEAVAIALRLQLENRQLREASAEAEAHLRRLSHHDGNAPNRPSLVAADRAKALCTLSVVTSS